MPKANDKYTKLPVVFHNLKGYDAHHIFEECAHLHKSSNKRINAYVIIPNNSESYMSISCGNIQFVDSCQHLTDSLNNLVNDFPDEKKVHTYKYFENKRLLRRPDQAARPDKVSFSNGASACNRAPLSGGAPRPSTTVWPLLASHTNKRRRRRRRRRRCAQVRLRGGRGEERDGEVALQDALVQRRGPAQLPPRRPACTAGWAATRLGLVLRWSLDWPL